MNDKALAVKDPAKKNLKRRAETLDAFNHLTWYEEGDQLITRAVFSARAADQALKTFKAWGAGADITVPEDHLSAISARCHIQINKIEAARFTENTGIEFKIETPDVHCLREDVHFLRGMGIHGDTRPVRLRSSSCQKR